MLNNVPIMNEFLSSGLTILRRDDAGLTSMIFPPTGTSITVPMSMFMVWLFHCRARE